jgi:N-acetylmuramoyl-L-alanine amidase
VNSRWCRVHPIRQAAAAQGGAPPLGRSWHLGKLDRNRNVEPFDSHSGRPKRCGLRVGGLVGIVALGTVGLPAFVARAPTDLITSAVTPVRLLSARVNDRRPGSGAAVDPSLFVKGSCVAFPPTLGDRHETVFLDAGHGGLDPGGIGVTESGETVDESDVNLPIELDAATLLRNDGYRVVVSRTGDSVVAKPGSADVADGAFTYQGELNDVAARDLCANLGKANVLIGIYMDVGGSSDNAGCLTGYDADRTFSAANLRLANLIQTDVEAAMNAQGWDIPNDGVQEDGELGGPPATAAAAAYDHLVLLGPAMAGYFDTPSEMPGALIEPLFITDPFEGSIAASAQGQSVIAGGIVDAVSQYFSPSTPRTSAAISSLSEPRA